MAIRKNIGLSREPTYVAFIAGFQCHAIQNIDQNKNQNRSIDKVRNLGNERR